MATRIQQWNSRHDLAYIYSVPTDFYWYLKQREELSRCLANRRVLPSILLMPQLEQSRRLEWPPHETGPTPRQRRSGHIPIAQPRFQFQKGSNWNPKICCGKQGRQNRQVKKRKHNQGKIAHGKVLHKCKDEQTHLFQTPRNQIIVHPNVMAALRADMDCWVSLVSLPLELDRDSRTTQQDAP
jgi:hypothetical protein